MTGRAYYNEIDPAAAHVLRALIAENVIAPGEVDERSIVDVRPADLRGFSQCHFFAGGGLWSVAARLAGWPDDRPLWTGSCPCQPFSVAGKGLGRDDPRHLWPHFHRLIAACRPAVCVGEQVSGSAGYDWLDGTCADLEREDYACEAFDIPACAVDAPHQRDRLYWVAARNVDDSERAGLEGLAGYGDDGQRWARETRPVAAAGRQESAQRGEGGRTSTERPAGLLPADSTKQQSECDINGHCARRTRFTDTDVIRNGSFWSDYEWIISPIDGKARRSKPGIRFLVDGLPGRVGLWRIGGNAIVPILAAEVLGALMDVSS